MADGRRENRSVVLAALSRCDFQGKIFMKNSRMNFLRAPHLRGSRSVFVVSLLFTLPVVGQTKAARSAASPASLEQRAEANLKAARENPLQLRHFLLGMPKGGDLHNHLTGAVYAESWIRAGAEDHLCVDIAKLAFVKLQTASSGGGDNLLVVTVKFPQPERSKSRICMTRLWMHFRCGDLCLRPG